MIIDIIYKGISYNWQESHLCFEFFFCHEIIVFAKQTADNIIS